MRRTKIVCTIGPATRDPEMLKQLMKAGMDVARLNFAHGSYAIHAENVERIRSAAAAVNKPVAIQVDLQGPKLRIGAVLESGIPLEAEREVTLTTEDIVGESPAAIPVKNEAFPEFVEPGDHILIDDGAIELGVVAVQGPQVRCKVLVGNTLKSNKGINLPGVAVDLPAITDKDRKDLARALEWEVDWVALSFVRSADDLRELKGLIRSRHGSEAAVPVIAKIEKPQALDNIEEIIQFADAVMVARGDLGIEIAPEKVPVAQKHIIRLCNRRGLPAITATQMLESMVRNPRPTRAEASDVANAIWDGTDAVMLSAETSIGAYPLEAVRTMDRIARETELQPTRSDIQPFEASEHDLDLSIADAVGRAAREAADDLKATAIITPTVSGYTATIMSRYRPYSPIVAITPDPRVQRRLMLYWGVTPMLGPRTDNTDEIIAHAIEAARERGLVQKGDVLVITGATAASQPGTTNLMRVHVVQR